MNALDEQYVAVPESYLAPEWRDWAAQPPATTRHGVDNTARALEAWQNTEPSLKKNGMTRTEKNRRFHTIIEKFLQQREEDRERPAPVALKVQEKKGSQKYVNITKQDTDKLLQAFLNIQQHQQAPTPQQHQQAPTPQQQQQPYPQTPTTSKEKKKKKKLLTPYQKSMVTRNAKMKAEAKMVDEKKLLDQQTGLGYHENVTSYPNNNNTIRPVHFTSLFTGLQTVLI